MGQARQRGTFEERKQAAMERNKKLTEAISNMPPGNSYRTGLRKLGAQKLATKMTMAGLMPQ